MSPAPRVAQQGLHVGAGAEVLADAAAGVLRGGVALRRCAALPVLHPVGEHEAAPDDHHRDDGVEDDLQRPGDVDEHHAVHVVVVVPVGDLRQDARHQGEDADGDAERDRDLVRLEALRRGRSRVVGVDGSGVGVSAHGGPHATASVLPPSFPTRTHDRGAEGDDSGHEELDGGRSGSSAMSRSPIRSTAPNGAFQ